MSKGESERELTLIWDIKRSPFGPMRLRSDIVLKFLNLVVALTNLLRASSCIDRIG